MDENVYHYLTTYPHLLNFVRNNPIWYRYLARNPERIVELENEAKFFYGQTFPQKLQKMNQNAQLIHMLTQLSKEMKD